MWEPGLESRSRDELAPLILERLRRTLERCRANPAHARRLGDVEPGDIRSVADWCRLPFLVKTELRDACMVQLAKRPSTTKGLEFPTIISGKRRFKLCKSSPTKE